MLGVNYILCLFALGGGFMAIFLDIDHPTLMVEIVAGVVSMAVSAIGIFIAYKKFYNYKNCEENMGKLWKYTNKKNNPTITYEEFVNFSIYLVHCVNAFSIAKYKHEHNNCFDNKIKNCVEIMNLHFKEYDTDNNQEITFENLKKCLLKENELFTRKEIEIILKQINPEQNFQ